jgi:hypothetical protein
MEEKKQKRWQRGVKRTGAITATGLVVCYLGTVIPLSMAGIKTLTWPTSIIVAMMFLYPILFFFMGMLVVWKKKLYPITKPDKESTIIDASEDKNDTIINS